MYYSIGLPAPAKVAPGIWLEWMATSASGVTSLGVDSTKKTEVGSFEQGEIAPFIDQAKFFIEQIGFVSRTPSPEMMAASTASGESLKQREIGLLGKVRRFQTKAGSAWREVFGLAWRVQATFGATPPEVTRLYPQWKSAEMRNDREFIANIKQIRDDLPRAEYLRLAGQVFGWDDAKIESIIAEKEQEEARAAAVLLPNFDQFNF